MRWRTLCCKIVRLHLGQVDILHLFSSSYVHLFPRQVRICQSRAHTPVDKSHGMLFDYYCNVPVRAPAQTSNLPRSVSQVDADKSWSLV